MTELPPDALRSAVRDAYSEIALSEGTSCCGPVPCCTDGSVSLELGYSSDERGAVPAGADLGLGCGNPGAIAALQPGETVLDLGSGAGFDAFLAARAVGPAGRVIGVDMTPAMVSKAAPMRPRATTRTWSSASGKSSTYPSRMRPST